MAFIITGGGTGIGRALALQLAKSGERVFIVGRRAGPLKDVTAQFPSNIKYVVADITKKNDRKRLVLELGCLGTGNCLINNAGIANPTPLANITEADLDAHMRVNFIAPLLLIRDLLPQLQDGRVLFNSSGLAHNAGPGMAAYGASKAAAFLVWKYLKAEFDSLSFGIAQPGMVDTDIQTRLRSCSTNQLPMRFFFKNVSDKGQLLKAETAGKFFKWLLCNLSNDEFQSKEWNIYDPRHWEHWANPGEVVLRDTTTSESNSTRAKL